VKEQFRKNDLSKQQHPLIQTAPFLPLVPLVPRIQLTLLLSFRESFKRLTDAKLTFNVHFLGLKPYLDVHGLRYPGGGYLIFLQTKLGVTTMLFGQNLKRLHYIVFYCIFINEIFDNSYGGGVYVRPLFHLFCVHVEPLQSFLVSCLKHFLIQNSFKSGRGSMWFFSVNS